MECIINIEGARGCPPRVGWRFRHGHDVPHLTVDSARHVAAEQDARPLHRNADQCLRIGRLRAERAVLRRRLDSDDRRQFPAHDQDGADVHPGLGRAHGLPPRMGGHPVTGRPRTNPR